MTEPGNVVQIDSARRRDLFPEGATGRRAFSPRRLADEALRAFDVGVLAGEVRVYSDGAYRSAGDRLRTFALDALGDDFTPRRLVEFVATLAMLAEPLPDIPDPRLAVFANTTIDVVTGEEVGHSPNHKMTIALPVRFEPGAKCPNIDAFLEDVLADDFQIRAREIAGYVLTSWNSLRAFGWLVGAPGQGKSTYADLLLALVGRENVSAVQPHALAESSFAGASLVGKLMNNAPDVSAADLRSVSLLKSTTGDDLVTVERKFAQPMTARIFATHIFASNTLPTFSDVSGAISSRVKVLEFERQTQRPDNPDLRALLTTSEELSGLAWQALRHLYELRGRGAFTENSRTRQALASFRSSTSTVAAFIDETCVLDPSARVRRVELWRAFTAWADDARKGQRTGRNSFFATLRSDHQLSEQKSDGDNYILGIRLANGFERVAS